MRKPLCLLLSWVMMSVCVLSAQQKILVNGKIVDRQTGDPLPAFVAVEGTDTGRTAGYDGTFSLDVTHLATDGRVRLSIFLIGYKKKTMEASSQEFLTVELELEPLEAHEVTVSADSVVSDSRVKNTVAIEKMEVYTIPGTAADPIYASQVLPGVNSAPDSSTLLIRGGSPEEVAFFFDGIEIAHPFLSESLHESYFSIFDNQIIDGFSVATSGFHTKFGDALSGVMDIYAKDSMFQKEGGVGLSLLGLNSYIGLPIKDLGSFVGSYNAGHSHLMTMINNRDDSEFKTQSGFAKLNVKLNNSHTLRLLGLFDRYDFSHQSGFSTGTDNLITGFSLTSAFRRNLVTRVVLSHVYHRADFQLPDVFEKNMQDRIFQARMNTTLDLGSHYIEFGGDFQNRRLEVGFAEPGFPLSEFRATGNRLGVYAGDRFRLMDTLFLDLGGRLSALQGRDNTLSFDPRVLLAYFLTRSDIIRFSVGRYSQFGDYFTLQENPGLGPKDAIHTAVSYDRITEHLDFRATVYDKQYHNLFLIDNEGLVTNSGKGYARGAEIFLKYSPRYFDALFVYNFLNSKRKENDVPVLSRSPYEIDHSFTGYFTMKFKNASVGIRYSFATGLPFTPLLGRIWDDAGQAYRPIWGSPFSQRLPSYRRMDLNGSKTVYYQNRMIVFYFGITNLFNRENLLRYEYRDEYSVRNNQYSIFGRSIFVGVYIPLF